ncbi:PaeR7I family type II restriction endonuclease [Bifidobacterium scaligerum]|uniref:Endonuclease n=1 Tax=Bifidobacterium scaligerum TaxID=2052656 RepID=A0A2M9HR64_9BIFI|nr:PaeR7I family type II restriction endonuclease [Bifidobacterium scaligerum]PJM79290.1 endonuclease [Bifidobacterium scaligerum]
MRNDVKEAVLHMYRMLAEAGQRQRIAGDVDRGHRAESTSGRHLDPLAELIREDLISGGFRPEDIFHGHAYQLRLPGWYRRSKDWDIVALNGKDDLVAAIELKSINSSFGNNANNRVEEALGSATDSHAAFTEHLYGVDSMPPALGYVMIVRSCLQSRESGRTAQPSLFPVDPVFQDASYLDRFRILCERLRASNLYQAVWLVYADPDSGEVSEPSPTLTYEKFIATITAALAIHRA